MQTALIQMTSTDDPGENLATMSEMITRAVGDGAGFVLTPEVCNCVSTDRSHQETVLRLEDEDPTLAGLRDLAAKLGIWLVIGSLALKTNDPDGRFANRSFAIAPDGQIAGKYDKIHMFDVQLSETESYAESRGYRPGKQLSIVTTPFGVIGLTICYDLRFPHIFRALAKAGADFLCVPSAFSVPTGIAHWEPLLRARAIENGAYLLAPAQVGTHPAQKGRSRETYGHSMAVSPWGKVLAQGNKKPDIIQIKLDRSTVAETRRRIPSLDHDRDFIGPK